MATATLAKPEAKSKYSVTTMKKAQKVLQRAHDYFETKGFNINSWSEVEEIGDFALGKKGQLDLGPCCYIGGIRLAAGVKPEPPSREEEDGGELVLTDDGDGPELKLALEIADTVAKRAKGSLILEPEENRVGAGALIENLGFQEETGEPEEDSKRAIILMRRALTEIDKKIAAAS